MARMKRIVVPGYPHHIVQSGVRSIDVFFKKEDRVEYLNLLKEQSLRFGVTYISYCLMTNHIHLLTVPEKEDSLAKAVGEAHRRYTRMINFRENVRGFLFQGRFSLCTVFTGEYLLSSIRYIEQNPTKAKIVKQPWKYKWSSAGFHCGEVQDDPLVQDSSLLPDISNWKKLLDVSAKENSQLKEKTITCPRNFAGISPEFRSIARGC
ncbi:MAG: transposase [Desulfobacteraceae bacterium]|nr:transposase [Desulfobacteraceae bacterium]